MDPCGHHRQVRQDVQFCHVLIESRLGFYDASGEQIRKQNISSLIGGVHEYLICFDIREHKFSCCLFAEAVRRTLWFCPWTSCFQCERNLPLEIGEALLFQVVTVFRRFRRFRRLRLKAQTAGRARGESRQRKYRAKGSTEQKEVQSTPCLSFSPSGGWSCPWTPPAKPAKPAKARDQAPG